MEQGLGKATGYILPKCRWWRQHWPCDYSDRDGLGTEIVRTCELALIVRETKCAKFSCSGELQPLTSHRLIDLVIVAVSLVLVYVIEARRTKLLS